MKFALGNKFVYECIHHIICMAQAIKIGLEKAPIL